MLPWARSLRTEVRGATGIHQDDAVIHLVRTVGRHSEWKPLVFPHGAQDSSRFGALLHPEGPP